MAADSKSGGGGLVNGDALWNYLNAMSVSMGAPAAGKVS